MRNDEEHQHQVLLAQWLNAHRIRWHHPPNEGKRSFAAAARLKAEGMMPGASDCIILTPAADGRPTCLELKAPGVTGAKGRPSDTQEAFLERMSRDCNVNVCWGFDDAVDWLESIGYGR